MSGGTRRGALVGEITRRTALAGGAAACAAATAGLPAVAEAEHDPALRAAREYWAYRNWYDYGLHAPSDEERDHHFARFLAKERAVYDVPATTLAGVAGKLRVYLYDVCDGDACRGLWGRAAPPPLEAIGADDPRLQAIFADLDRLGARARS